MDKKIAILSEHNIDFFEIGPRLFADAQLNGTNTGLRFDDVTDMTVAALYSWLGY